MNEVLLVSLMTIYWAAAVALQVYGLNCYVMIFLFQRRRRERLRGERQTLARFQVLHSDAELPVVTTQLPVYNERNVVERLLRAVAAFDYPADKHEIQVLDDSTDETSDLVRSVAAELRARGLDVKHIRRDNRRGYKAGALEEGLCTARGEMIAVFDADFVPPPDFLRQTVPFLVLDPECGFVQTRWGHRNRGFSALTRVQAIGIDGHFVIEQSARSWNGLFLNFNGTGGVWRKRAITEAGGWHADTLTEDLDLSYRTQLVGFKPTFLLEVVTPAELPTDINALKSQQHRWAKGSIQTAKKLLPAIWRRPDVPIFKKLQATLHLTHYMVHPLMLIMTVLVLPLLVWNGFALWKAWFIVPFTLAFIAVFAPTAMYLTAQCATNRDWLHTLWLLPLLMAMGIGLAVNNTRAVLDGFIGRPSEFVRTPKLGEAAEETRRRSVRGSPWAGGALPRTARVKHYRLSRGWIFAVEILVGLWAGAAFLEYVALGNSVIGPVFLFLQATGFTYIGVLSLMHDLRGRRHAA